MDTAFVYCGWLIVGSAVLCIATELLERFYNENYYSEQEFFSDTPLKFAIAVWVFSALAISIAIFGCLGFMPILMSIITNVLISVFIIFKILEKFEIILK